MPGLQAALALEAVPFLFVTNLPAAFFFQWGQQIEGDVGGLEALGLGMGNVVH